MENIQTVPVKLRRT